MIMGHIAIISGSPSVTSRSERVLHYIGELLQYEGFNVAHISVLHVKAEDLLYGNFESKALLKIIDTLEKADGVIIGSPVYKASYSGVLKALVDLLPQDILQGKTVLPIMTGGSAAHLLAVDYALKPLIHAVKGETVQGLYFQDSEIDRNEAIPIIDEKLLNRTEKVLKDFREKLQKNEAKHVKVV